MSLGVQTLEDLRTYRREADALRAELRELAKRIEMERTKFGWTTGPEGDRAYFFGEENEFPAIARALGLEPVQ